MKNKQSVAEWLGLKRPFDYLKSPNFGGLMSVALTLCAITFVILLWGMIGIVFEAVFKPQGFNQADEIIRNVGLALAALVGLPFLVWRSIVAQNQVRIAEQGMITDRINKAVEGLGAEKTVRRHRHSKDGTPLYHLKTEQDEAGTTQIDLKHPVFEEFTTPNLEVRLGAIYSLERIAKDSPRDHISVMEILCAYVRENARYSELKPSEDYPEAQTRTDIQAVVTVLARREPWQVSIESEQKFRLDLSFCDLTGADFKQGNFGGALFSRSILERAIFDRCNLAGARFQQAMLNYSSLLFCNLTGARWWQAQFTHDGKNALTGAVIKGLELNGANVSSLDFLMVTEPLSENIGHQDRKTFGSRDTLLNSEFRLPEKYEQTMKLNEIVQDTVTDHRSIASRAKAKVNLEKSPFEFWSDQPHLSFKTAELRQDFREKLGLTGWPYEDD